MLTSTVLVVGGLVLVGLSLLDLFLTVFNFDGLTFIAGRFQRALWKVIRYAASLLPGTGKAFVLSFGSAAMVPATVLMWLIGEVLGFALIYTAGLSAHGFSLSHGLSTGFGSAVYLSAGAISTLALGDIIPTTAVLRAACDLEAVIGLATFTLALGYVVTTFNVLSDLDVLHNTVRRHASNPERPSSILVRHYRGGSPSELPDFLQVLSQSLESYDEGLRRYPVVYYFHSRRVQRSVPRVFWSLGEILALIRWGLPADDQMTRDPWLAALLDQYSTTVGRLQRSFVGPWPRPSVPAPPCPDFSREYSKEEPDDDSVRSFVALQIRARLAAGVQPERDGDAAEAYHRYCEWFHFAHRRDEVLDRVSNRLGYQIGDVVGTAPTQP